LDKSSLSERDICSKFITPALQRAGWDVMRQIREEVSLTRGRIIVRRRGCRAHGAGGLLPGRQRQDATLLPSAGHQPHRRSHRQGTTAPVAGHGHRYRQDLHRLPDHLAAVEGRSRQTHFVPGWPQRAGRPDHGQRFPPLRPVTRRLP